jgi:beta-barrel assembly-enhancing protease
MKPVAFALAASLVAGSAVAGPFDWTKVLEAGVDMVKTVKASGEEEEIALGQQWAATLLGAAPLWRDEAAQTYVNQVGRWLTLHSERPQLPWRFGVLDSPNINAFATPGGHVFVTRGLLAQMRSEAELAGVLAHEIAHVLRKHHLNAVLKQQGVGIGAELLSQYAAHKGKHAGTTEKVLGGLKEVAVRGLDKKDEYEADRMALVIAARAGYDPYGLVQVLQTLQTLNAQDSALALLFDTHPAPAARLDALEVAAGAQLDAQAGQPQHADRYARYIRAR